MDDKWLDLGLFIHDPQIPLDNNHTERGMRRLAVGRKNHYGSKSLRGTEVAAIFYSLIETAHRIGLDPKAYLLAAALAAIRDPKAPVVDKSPPWFENLRCEPNCKIPAGTPLALAGIARDKTRLGGVTARLDQPADGPPLHAWPTLTDAQDLALPLPQLAVGMHELTLQAVDLAGHATSATLAITVCDGPCEPVQVAGKPIEVNGTRPEGCSAGRAGRPLALLVVLAAVVLVLRGLRRNRNDFEV